MKLTRIHHCKNLNVQKYKQLEKQAVLLGRIRSEVWAKYGAISGLNISDRAIRDAWMKESRDFGVSANAWKETLRDCIGDIKAYREASKDKVKQAIRKRTSCNNEQKRLYTLLKKDEWMTDNFLHRQMRNHFKHGVNHTHNQIIVRADMCKTFELNGQCWLKVPSLVPRQTIKIPLNTTVDFAPQGTLRIILKNGNVEVHSTYDAVETQDCGQETVGVDKGYSEAFVDSDGEVYGNGLGKLISSESDYLNQKYKRRNKLRAISKAKPHKKQKIELNNLGRKKLDKRQDTQKAKLKTLIFTATHKLVDKAKVIVAEDLTSPIQSKRNYGKNTNRRLNTWAKGLLANALTSISHRRGSTVHLVNSAYTSQSDSFLHGLLIGTRKGDRFHRFNGEVVQADWNAARNVLARLNDNEISRYTPYKTVKRILQERTDRYKSELTDSGSSYTLGNKTLTECELVLDYV
ncbi:IS200/IS605 family accessory protein TnpB-related protein [Acinetobacter sp. YH16051]|nr:IS200/IS605 family accessory protein TnpB-related protein [Acinetobacter sp. PW68]